MIPFHFVGFSKYFKFLSINLDICILIVPFCCTPTKENTTHDSFFYISIVSAFYNSSSCTPIADGVTTFTHIIFTGSKSRALGVVRRLPVMQASVTRCVFLSLSLQDVFSRAGHQTTVTKNIIGLMTACITCLLKNLISALKHFDKCRARFSLCFVMSVFVMARFLHYY